MSPPPITFKPPRAVVILGAQRFDTTLGSTVKDLEVRGPFAVITAGWQEREAEDDDLREHLAVETVNLRLHKRAEEVFRDDPELAAAHRKRQEILRHKQDFYRIRLEHYLEANHVIRQRKAPQDVLDEEQQASLAAIRALDDYHLAQCERVHQEFTEAMRPGDRKEVARHRDEIRKLTDGCEAIAIAGGHVASLVNRLYMFAIYELVEDRAVFAWSGGAMAITDRIVLFHDRPPQGPGLSEVLDRGLGLVPGVVVLPQPEARLRLDDPLRVSVLAGRFEPDLCLAMPAGAHVQWRPGVGGGVLERASGVICLHDDGECAPLRDVTHPSDEGGAVLDGGAA